MSNNLKKLLISFILIFVSLICFIVLVIPKTTSEQKPIESLVSAINSNNAQAIKTISDPYGLSSVERCEAVIEEYRTLYIPNDCTFKRMDIVSLQTVNKEDSNTLKALGIGGGANVIAVVKISYTTVDNEQKEVFEKISFSLEKLNGKYYFSNI